MIAFLRGEVADLTENYVVLDVNGVGYQVGICGRDVQDMPGTGETVKLYTYLSVYQDGISLYGFLSKDDLTVFKELLAVSGIGPKAALGVLTVMTANDLRFAVFSDDVKTISKAPGIGPKTAKKMILELKDRLKLGDALEESLSEAETGSSAGKAADADREQRNEAVAALISLGYSNSEALRAVRAVKGESLTVEQILKEALKRIM